MCDIRFFRFCAERRNSLKMRFDYFWYQKKKYNTGEQLSQKRNCWVVFFLISKIMKTINQKKVVCSGTGSYFCPFLLALISDLALPSEDVDNSELKCVRQYKKWGSDCFYGLSKRESQSHQSESYPTETFYRGICACVKVTRCNIAEYVPVQLCFKIHAPQKAHIGLVSKRYWV